jgi:hypothetical protein
MTRLTFSKNSESSLLCQSKNCRGCCISFKSDLIIVTRVLMSKVRKKLTGFSSLKVVSLRQPERYKEIFKLNKSKQILRL